MTDLVLQAPGEEDRPTPLAPVATPADRLFKAITTTAALVSLGIVLVTLIFLVDKAQPAFKKSGVIGFFTHSYWLPSVGRFGVLGLLENTILIAVIALAVGVPLSLSMAVFINEYAPRRVKAIITSVIDLLAALPSLLFGIWGKVALETPVTHLAQWMNHHLSVLPIFRLTSSETTLAASTLEAGLVVGVMIIPIVTSVSRDVMAQVPREQCEGALALGGTKWGMVRDVILPFGRSGIFGGVILGFGRALGETIAVLFIVSQIVKVNTHILASGSGSIASQIALLFNDASPLGRAGLVAAGLALFILTFIVNLIARVIVVRSGRFA